MAAPPRRRPSSSCHPPRRATTSRCRLIAIGRAAGNCRSSTGCRRGPRTGPPGPQSPGRRRRTAAKSPSRPRSREEKRESPQRRALHWAQPVEGAAGAAPGTGRPRGAAARCAHGAVEAACYLRAEQSGPAFSTGGSSESAVCPARRLAARDSSAVPTSTSRCPSVCRTSAPWPRGVAPAPGAHCAALLLVVLKTRLPVEPGSAASPGAVQGLRAAATRWTE